MDAHVFRCVGKSILDLLHGARIEKIHSPFPDVTQFLCYKKGEKFRLILRSGKKSPSFFLSRSPLPNPERPKAFVMRLRKYVSGLRLGLGKMDIEKRCLCLPIYKKNIEQPFSLFLDIKKGAYISEQSFTIKPSEWPREQDISKFCLKDNKQESCQITAMPWTSYPLLTPLLRETLSLLSLPEALALMIDLEAGGGNLFFYKDTMGKPKLYTAWPLPQEMLAQKALTEMYEDEWYHSFDSSPHPDFLRCSAIDEHTLLEDFALTRKNIESTPQKKKENKIKKILVKLDHEEKRLLAMTELQKEAQAIQEILWQYPAEYKAESFTINNGQEKKALILDPRLTLRENMAVMFKKVAKGKRGLVILKHRRAELTKEEDIPIQRHEIKKGSKEASFKPSLNTIPLKQHTEKQGNSLVVQFISTDGYVMLRGKNAKGNQYLLKIAQPYDYWLHTFEGTSAHVIIRRAHMQDEPPQTTLEEAATLVAEKSHYKNDTNVDIMLCLVKDVHTIKGAPAGTVKVNKVHLHVYSKK